VVDWLLACPEKGFFRGQTLVRRLRGRTTVRMSTDEILALTRK
jgi:hypothetical protein